MQRWSGFFGKALLIAGAVMGGLPAYAQGSQPGSDPALRTVRSLLATPEAELDLAKAKLTIDHLIDPQVNVSRTLMQLDAMAAQVKAQLPADANSRAKLVTLMSYLYRPDPSSGQRPFSYDLDDPFGKNIQNKLLTTYLTTRKGNCVSMPVLFVILAQKIGLDATLSTAPAHVLAKFRDDDGRLVNVENTSVGTKSDSSYARDMGITEKALQSGIYLRQLSKRESVVVMTGTLMEVYGKQHQQANRIAVADLALRADPRYVEAMLQKGSAYFRLLEEQYLSKYPSVAQIPPEQREAVETLDRNGALWFNKAETLGWRHPDQVQDARYQQSIQRAKTKQ
jgi:regulator of sirC expression with transglutaminase-like and TPR domain